MALVRIPCFYLKVKLGCIKLKTCVGFSRALGTEKRSQKTNVHTELILTNYMEKRMDSGVKIQNEPALRISFGVTREKKLD